MTLARAITDKIGTERAALKLPLPVLIYLLAVLIPATLQIGPLFLTLPRIYLVVMFIPLLIMLVSGKHGRIMITDILFLLHAGWMGVALAVNNPGQVVTQVGSIVPDFYGAYLLARLYIRTPETFMALIRWLGLAMVVFVPLAIYETLTGTSIVIKMFDRLPVFGTYGQVWTERRMGLERVQGVMVNPIHFGLLCSTVFSLTVLGLQGAVSDGRRLLAGASSALCTFLSLSSGAFLALLLQIILLAWHRIFRATGRPWLILLLVMMLAYVTIDLFSNRTPIRVFMSYATFSSHTAYWRGMIFDWGMKNVWANPIFGLGLNDWVRPSFMYSGSMDNFWLVMAVRYGIPGFLLLAIGYGIALWRVGRRNLAGDKQLIRLRRAWIISFASLTFTLCTVHVWNNAHSYVFFLFGSGMWFLSAVPGAAKEHGAETGTDAPGQSGGGLRHSRFPLRPRSQQAFARNAVHPSLP